MKNSKTLILVFTIMILGTIGVFVLVNHLQQPKDIIETPSSDFKAAVLIPGPVIDGGWNSLAYEGIQEAGKDLDIHVSHVMAETALNQGEHFREYANEGYNIIFGHGFEFQDPAKLTAPDFPNTIFITSGGSTITENISPMIFRMEQGIYLCGVLAAHLTKTNKIGIIGGQSQPALNSGFDAFEAGIKSVDPDIEVNRVYVGDWLNTGKAKELALAQVEQGIDIIFPNAGAAEVGAYEVIRQEGLYTFGAYLNRTQQAPDSVIINVIIDPQLFVHMTRLVKEGTFESKSHQFNWITHPEIIRIEWNPKVKRELPLEVIGIAAVIEEQIRREEITVPMADY